MAVLQMKQRIVGTANCGIFIVEEMRGSNQQTAKRNNNGFAPAMYINVSYNNNSKSTRQ